MRDKRVLVTGGTGFLGQHVVAALRHAGAEVAPAGSLAVNLLRSGETHRFFCQEADPETIVVHLAYPGSRYGIETSVRSPYTLASNLIQMDLNVIRECTQRGVAKLLCVGSVCSYPEHTTLPTDESQFWNGYPEPVNAAYGLAKRTQLSLLQVARQEHGLHGIHLILANMYGPGDRSGHVIPALITRMRQAKQTGEPMVVWGAPEVTRSFLYVEDAAEGIVRALQSYDSPEPLNLVRDEETSMGDLVAALAKNLHGPSEVTYDLGKPTGHRRRCFDNHRLQAALGWTPPTPFAAGLAKTIEWHLTHVPLQVSPKESR